MFNQQLILDKHKISDMVMKKLSIALFALSLASCSNVSDLKKTAPVFSIVTSKSVNKYSTCVLNEWNKHTYLQPVSTQPFNEGNSFQFNDPYRGPVFILDVVPVSNGSKVTLFKSRDIDFYELEARNCI